MRKLKIKITPELFVLIEIIAVLLILTLGLFLYLQILKAKSENLRKEVEALHAQRNLDLEREIRREIDFFERMKMVLKDHIAPTKIFNLLEENLLPNVVLNSLTFEPVTEEGKLIYKLTLDFSALSPEILIEQFFILKEALKKEKIAKINIGGVSIGQSEYKVIFEIGIDPKVLRYFQDI